MKDIMKKLGNESKEDKVALLKEFVNEVESNLDGATVSYTLSFDSAVDIRLNEKKVITQNEVAKLNLFVQGARLRYTKSKKNGYNINTLAIEHLASVSAQFVTEKDRVAVLVKRAKVLAKQIPAGVWPNVKEQLLSDPMTNFPKSDFRPIYYAVRFNADSREELREIFKANFDARSEFAYEQATGKGSGNGRDLELSFTSDNGDYAGMLLSKSPRNGETDVLMILNEKVAFYVDTIMPGEGTKTVTGTEVE